MTHDTVQDFVVSTTVNFTSVFMYIYQHACSLHCDTLPLKCVFQALPPDHFQSHHVLTLPEGSILMSLHRQPQNFHPNHSSLSSSHSPTLNPSSREQTPQPHSLLVGLKKLQKQVQTKTFLRNKKGNVGMSHHRNGLLWSDPNPPVTYLLIHLAT